MDEKYLLFVTMVLITVASPGPGVLMTLDNAIACGWRTAMYGVAGLAVGAALMAGLSSAGVGLLVRSSPALFTTMKYCGVGYLLYLSCKAWNRQPSPSAHGPRPQGSESVGGWGLLVRGVLLQTSNPKALLFFLSILPQMVEGKNAQGSSADRLIIGIATYCVALLLIHATYAGAAAKARTWLATPFASRLLSRVSAVVFAGFAVTMLMFQL